MPLIHTSALSPSAAGSQQIYNGLDCCLTHEIYSEISKQLSETNNPAPALIYGFERALQAPALDMMLRGVLTDRIEVEKGVALLRRRIDRYQGMLDQLALAAWDKPLNPRSPKQLIDFFYSALKLPEQWTSKKGVKKLSMDREALEKLDIYLHARPFANLILAIRDEQKALQVLDTEIDADGRMRTSYNIAGTETGRWSSSKSSTGTGTNLQNIARDPDEMDEGLISLRKIFIADPGWKFCGIDLEQAESREVGWLCGTLFNEWSYLDACYSGDLHTLTAKLIWPQLEWPSDPKGARALADTTFYRNYSYRDMSKRGGHGCLTADHEVLTRKGWVPISHKPAEIMAWSPTGSYFTPVDHWTDKLYHGDMVAIEGTSISLDATADHRVYLTKDRSKPDCIYHVVPAEDLPKAGGIPLGFGYRGGNASVSVPLARLIAAFQADGHQNSINRVSFHLKKDRKIQRLIQLAEAASIPYSVQGNKVTLEASGWPKLADRYLLDWPIDALIAYITEYKHWDGHIASTATSLFSTDLQQLEWLQTIGRLVGIGGNIQKPHQSGFGSVSYTLQQNNRKFADLASLRTTVRKDSGRVYCPTVPTGAFYVRRNGKISVTGNSNYYGKPFTMARHLKVPTELMTNFQTRYFAAFPGIPMWHQWVAKQLQTTHSLITPFGRQRHFFGRPGDDTTLREAIAFSPQSSTADRMNLILWRLWHHMPEIRLVAQVHDAVYFMYRPEDEPEIIRRALTYFDLPLHHGTHILVVPGEAKVGWNFGNYHPRFNPDGMKKWKGSDDRERHTGLNRIL